MASFEKLPTELIDQILGFVEQDIDLRAKTYRALSRTSRTLRCAVIPSLYRRCDLPNHVKFAKCITTLRESPVLARHFKDLKLEEMTKLNVQQISKAKLKDLLTYLANTGNIEQVSLPLFKKAVYHGSVESLIALICALATEVELISLQTLYTPPGQGKKRVKAQLPCLSQMMRYAMANQDSSTYNGPFKTLRSFELKSHKGNSITWELLQILCEMPALESLTLKLGGSRGRSSAGYLPIVDLQARSNLKSFTYHGFKLDSRAIAYVVSRCKSLQSIDMGWKELQDLGPQNDNNGLTGIMKYLTKHEDSLQHLRIYAENDHAVESLEGTLRNFVKLESVTLNKKVLMSAVDLYADGNSQSYAEFLPSNIKSLTIPDWDGDETCTFAAAIAMTGPRSLDSVIMVAQPSWENPVRFQPSRMNTWKFFSIHSEYFPEQDEDEPYGYRIILKNLSYVRDRFESCERDSKATDLDEELLDWDSDGDHEPADEVRRDLVKRSGMTQDFNELQYVMNTIEDLE